MGIWAQHVPLSEVAVCSGQRSAGNHELRTGCGGRAIVGVGLQRGNVMRHRVTTKQLWNGDTWSWKGIGRATVREVESSFPCCL